MRYRFGTTTLAQAVAAGTLVEPWVDLEDRADPVVAFGQLEAKRHRVRGIGLEMFLRLMEDLPAILPGGAPGEDR